MSKCMPIDTNQHNPTKIIDGCQVIIKILADKKQLLPKMRYTIWLKLRKRKRNSQHVPPCGKGIYMRWQHLIFFLFMYMVQLYKDWEILHMLGCRAVALPSTKQIVRNFSKN